MVDAPRRPGILCESGWPSEQPNRKPRRIVLESSLMTPENGKMNPDSPGGSRQLEGSRKPYGPPRLRSLGSVNAITLPTSNPQSEAGARKKPQG
jgi:hypothetical protein